MILNTTSDGGAFHTSGKFRGICFSLPAKTELQYFQSSLIPICSWTCSFQQVAPSRVLTLLSCTTFSMNLPLLCSRTGGFLNNSSRSVSVDCSRGEWLRLGNLTSSPFLNRCFGIVIASAPCTMPILKKDNCLCLLSFLVTLYRINSQYYFANFVD